jgi:hypothetical protein
MYDNLWGAGPSVVADRSVETERTDMKETAHVTRLGKLVDARLRLQRKLSYARKPE